MLFKAPCALSLNIPNPNTESEELKNLKAFEHQHDVAVGNSIPHLSAGHSQSAGLLKTLVNMTFGLFQQGTHKTHAIFLLNLR